MSDELIITRINTPIHLEYQVTAGRVQSRFLRELMKGRLIGMRCPETGKVYVPPPGVSPVCGLPFEEEVEVSDTGTLTSFCVINIPFEGQQLEPPYTCGSILLDGADLPLFHLINAPPEEVRMGLRVKAVWGDPVPSVNTIRWFEPTGEPDAPFASYEEHL